MNNSIVRHQVPDIVRAHPTPQDSTMVSTNGLSEASRMVHDRSIAARGTGNNRPTNRSLESGSSIGSGVNQASAPIQSSLTSAPQRSQGRLLLTNFGVNEWRLTTELLRQLKEFTQLLLSSADYEILLIEGRASNTGPESEENVRSNGSGPGNIELSRLRAETVAQYLHNRDLTSAHTPRVQAHGSSSPIILADGEIADNRSVMISYTYISELPLPELIPPDPIVSQRWALSISESIGASFVGGGQLVNGKLKNLVTNRIYNISIWQVGLGAGIPVGVSGAPDNFENFRTRRLVDVYEFHDRRCLLSSVTVATIAGGRSFTAVLLPFTNEEIRFWGPVNGLAADAFAGVEGEIQLKNNDLRRAIEERRDYNRRVEEFNRQQRARRASN